MKYLKAIFCYLFIIILAYFANVSWAKEEAVFPVNSFNSAISPSQNNSPEFAPNRIIVKFKKQTTQTPNSLKAVVNKLTTTSLSVSPSVEKLFQKYQVQSIKNVLDQESTISQTTIPLKKKSSIAFLSTQNSSVTTATSTHETSLKKRIQIAKQKYPQRFARAVLPLDVDWDSIYIIEVGKYFDVTQAVKDFAKDPAVEYAQLDYKMKLYGITPDTGDVLNLWGLHKINTERAWDITRGKQLDGRSIIVAVLDSGVDYNHKDIKDNIWTNIDEIPDNGIDDDNNGFNDDVHGYDFTYYCRGRYDSDGNCLGGIKVPGADPMDMLGHGTHVAGTIAATGSLANGVRGIAPEVKIMPIKALDQGGIGFTSDIAAGMLYATLNGADVVNNSWGSSGRISSDPLINDVVRFAYSSGVVMVFAAGNSRDDVVFYSSNMNQVITVAAIDKNDSKDSYLDEAWFSNFGSRIDLAAPGVDIWSLKPGNGYQKMSGTSMAAPHVTAAAALILAQHPEFNVEQVRDILKASADDIIDHGPDNRSGAGRLNVLEALKIVQTPKAEIQSPSKNQYIDAKETNTINIIGTSTGESYQLFYSQGIHQNKWIPLTTPIFRSVVNDQLTRWDIKDLKPDTYWLRLVVMNQGRPFQKILPIIIRDPLFKTIATTQPLNHIQQLKIFEDKVAWFSFNHKYNYDVFLYDSTASKQGIEQISNDTYLKESLSFSNNRLVWQQIEMKEKKPTWEIVSYEIGQDIIKPISGNFDKVLPYLDGNLLFYGAIQQKDGWGGDIYRYNFGTKTNDLLVQGDQPKREFNYKDGILVWMDARFIYEVSYLKDGKQIIDRLRVWNIYFKKVDPSYPGEPLLEIPVIPENELKGHNISEIVFDGKMIYYTDTFGNPYPLDCSGSTYNIFSYNIRTLEKKALTQSCGYKGNLVISNGKLVWVNLDNPQKDCYGAGSGYDLRSCRSKIHMWDTHNPALGIQELTNDSAAQFNPAIFKDKIYWVDYRNEKNDIYYIDLNDQRPPQINAPSFISASVGEPIEFEIKALDQRGNPAILTVNKGNVDAVFESTAKNRGLFKWFAQPHQIGTHTITLRAEDDQHMSSTKLVNIKIKPRLWPSEISSPDNGAELKADKEGRVKFTWHEVGESRGVVHHLVVTRNKDFRVGPYSRDVGEIYDHYQGTNTSADVPGIMMNGKEIYVILYSFIDNQWKHKSYAYKTPMLINDPPVISLDNLEQNVNEGDTVNINVSAKDPEGESVALELNNGNEWGASFKDNRDGTGTLIWKTKIFNEQLSYDFYFTAKDPSGRASRVKSTVNLRPIPIIIPAEMNLVNGSVLESDRSGRVRFSWFGGGGNFDVQYHLVITRKKNFIVDPLNRDAGEIYDQFQGQATSVDVPGLTMDGNDIYVVLYTGRGSTWEYKTYTYKTKVPLEVKQLELTADIYEQTAHEGDLVKVKFKVNNAQGNVTLNLFGDNSQAFFMDRGDGTGLLIWKASLMADNRPMEFIVLARDAMSKAQVTVKVNVLPVILKPAVMDLADGAELVHDDDALVHLSWHDIGSKAFPHHLVVTRNKNFNPNPLNRDRGEIYDAFQGTNTSAVVNWIRMDGRDVYVWLYTLINNEWKYNAYVYKTKFKPKPKPPVLISPISSQLNENHVIFTWRDDNEGRLKHRFNVSYIERTREGIVIRNVFAKIYPAGVISSDPIDLESLHGKEISVQIATQDQYGWVYAEDHYKYKVNLFFKAEPATINLPEKGSILIADPQGKVRFSWHKSDDDPNVRYHLAITNNKNFRIGPINRDIGEIYDQFQDTKTSADVAIPMDGQDVYVILYTIRNSTWKYTVESYKTKSKPVNHPPVVNVDPTEQTVTEGDVVQIKVSASDPENERMTLELLNGHQPGVDFKDNGDGTGTLTWQAKILSQQLTYEFVFIAKDKNGNNAKATAIVNVQPIVIIINKAPSINLDPLQQTVFHGDMVMIKVSAKDPEGDSLTLELESGQRAGVNFKDNGDGTGTLTWQAKILPNQLNYYEFNFIAKDQMGNRTEAKAIVIVKIKPFIFRP